MSIAAITPSGWWRPGCGAGCSLRGHDPDDHETYGRLLEQRAAMPRVVRTGGLVIDLMADTVSVDDVEVAITKREWSLLAYLAIRIGQWRSAEDILGNVWGPEWVTRLYRTGPAGERYRTDTHVLEVARFRLRASLGTAGSLIEIRRGAMKASDTRLAYREVTA